MLKQFSANKKLLHRKKCGGRHPGLKSGGQDTPDPLPVGDAPARAVGTFCAEAEPELESSKNVSAPAPKEMKNRKKMKAQNVKR